MLKINLARQQLQERKNALAKVEKIVSRRKELTPGRIFNISRLLLKAFPEGTNSNHDDYKRARKAVRAVVDSAFNDTVKHSEAGLFLKKKLENPTEFPLKDWETLVEAQKPKALKKLGKGQPGAITQELLDKKAREIAIRKIQSHYNYISKASEKFKKNILAISGEYGIKLAQMPNVGKVKFNGKQIHVNEYKKLIKFTSDHFNNTNQILKGHAHMLLEDVKVN